MPPLEPAAAQAHPPFEEPWQAQVYAMAHLLIARGRISAADWAETLGLAIRARLAAGAADSVATYYQAVADAVERVLGLEAGEVSRLADAWRDAHETTPHGQPVTLPPDPSGVD